MSDKKRVFSGMQPTGEPHLGNLMGAFGNWVSMQDEHETIYCVVDLHAMTVPYRPDEMRSRRRGLARMLIAVGIDPARSLLYYQSEVPQHVELSWALGTLTGLGKLARMTQFKDKADKAGRSLSLLAYPVLMAADILIHRVHAVPVGDDQAQHLELTRDLAEAFNSRFGEVFPIPERITPEIGARVMSLTDPASKMSKSGAGERSYILLSDSADQIARKIKSAVTDAGTEVGHDWGVKPGVSNLLEMLSFFSGRPIDDLVDEHRSGGYGAFKTAVAEAVVEGIRPIREAYEGLSDAEVAEAMSSGAERARDMAGATITVVREAAGLA